MLSHKDQILENTLKCIQEWIRSSDQKVSIFLAFQGISTSLLAPYLIKWITQHFLKFNLMDIILITSGVALLSYSIGKSVLALMPRLKRKTNHKTLIFFGDISQYDYKDFEKEFKNSSPKKYVEDLIEQVYTSSKIASCKYSHFKDAIYLYFIAVIVLIISLISYLIK